MKIKKILLSIIIGLMIICEVTVANGLAQNDPPNISVSLATNKLSYLLDVPGTPQADPEKIQMNLSLKNNDLTDIITSKGFSALPFHLMLTFIDPDGKGITTKEIIESLSGDPPPPPVLPVGGQLIQAEPVEILPDGRPGGVSNDPTWTLSLDIPDAHAYYSLTKAGRYSVKAIIPMRTYPPPIDYTVSSVPYEQIDSSTWAEAIESNTVTFSLLADADGDGYYYPDAYGSYNLPDCNDGNPNVNPGVSEISGNGIDDDCNPSTPDGIATKVIVAHPNGGEVLPSGGIYGICWAAPPNTVKFDLKYSTNNGVSWNLIRSVTRLNCTNWDIPVETGNKTQCFIKVIGYDSADMQVGEDISDKPFAIEVVRVTSPNGGETLTSGSTWTIRWETHETIRPIAKTELGYRTAGTSWKRIRTLTGNPESYNVKIPYVTTPKKGKVLVRLRDASGNILGMDTSDAAFTIQP